jgi:hypothetical protein
MSKKVFLIVAQFLLISGNLFAQVTPETNSRVIQTAVPFLIIGPESRGGALGDAGAATSPDAVSMYWNPAKMAFLESNLGASVSYTPWLRALGVNDVFLSYLSGYYKIRKEDVIGVSMTYFSMGTIPFVDNQGQNYYDFNPNEFAFNVAYSRLLSENFSLGVGVRYFRSNLSGSIAAPSGQATRPANGASADVSAFYTKPLVVGGNSANLAFGANISNIGPKVSYNQSSRDFLPTNLRLGTAFTLDLDLYNKITFTTDINKLLVPSDNEQAQVTPLFSGIFGSFTDAPGGFSEELNEIIYSGGVEYWYNDLFAVRGGYFHEHATKGNRKYFTAGVGFRYQKFGLDMAYLIPRQQNSPLAETLRFSLLFDLGKEATESVTD